MLAGLVRLQILSQETSRFSAEFGQYQFVQSVVRQVAYATLSRRDRKATHLAVLEPLTRERSPEVAPVVAQHCIAAIEAVPDAPDVPELTVRAVRLLRQAADRARSLGSPSEAAGHSAAPSIWSPTLIWRPSCVWRRPRRVSAVIATTNGNSSSAGTPSRLRSRPATGTVMPSPRRFSPRL